MDRLLTVREVARALRVHPKTVGKWAREQRIRCYRLGRVVRFAERDVLAWLSARKEG